jgi:hypothetical protein
MKVVQLKEAKASIERRKHKDDLVLASYDKLARGADRERRTARADVERKARGAL